MKKKVILHSGLHKTASTSIQESLSNIHLELLNQRILYPLLEINGHTPSNHSFMMYSLFCEQPEKYHINQKWGFDTEDKAKKLNETYKEFLRKSINNNDYDTIIISAEDIFSLDKNGLTRLYSFFIDNFDVTLEVVFYIRHICDYLQSVIQQRVKDGGWEELLFSEIKSGKIGKIAQKINEFDSIFGKNNVSAYKYEEAILYPNGIVNHFLNIILNTNNIHIDNIISNTSLSYESFTIHSKINKNYPLYSNGTLSQERKYHDLLPLVKLKGAKFSLNQSFFDQCYLELFEEFKYINDRFNISYAPKTVQSVAENDRWNINTLNQIDEIMPNLSTLVKREIINLLRDECGKYKDIDNNKAFNLIKLARKYRKNGPHIKKLYLELDEKVNKKDNG